ncbi:phage baseplate upper protein [Fructobacillus sp. M158]|uniref:BppU family phage baseplate upper protein n=1 Tax=Fructobacillus parabroussonetiae TaxID=2713174 RepID=UPI00200A737D|nr:BppU family phage baseplate upper protein [Fructobacillus parabroussonetiae]MCK8617564.1 phage baseplate upper protein [Fructobacillus parabroussonetiae]
MAKNYVELNTNLEINQTAIVPALNGRQGDNDREVGFWIKEGKFPMDLSNKTIKLFAKDASGVVKETESINDRTGITAGRFTLLIQKEFYQAVGQVEDSFIQISDKENGQIVSTIPVSFTVLENKMVVTQTQSQLYLDTVQKTIDNFNERIKSAGTNLEVLENAQKHLLSVVDNINQEFNSDLFAKTKEDNTFKGNNTFEKPIVAPAGIQGKADTAGQADEATHAISADNADNANHAEVADKLVPENDQTVNYLTVKGEIKGKDKVYIHKYFDDSRNIGYIAKRYGNSVDINIYNKNGDAKSPLSSNNTIINSDNGLPAGFRPAEMSYGSLFGDSQSAILAVWIDGAVSSNRSALTQENYWHLNGSAHFTTNDDFPE